MAGHRVRKYLAFPLILIAAGLIGYFSVAHILFLQIGEIFLDDLRLYGLSKPMPQSEKVVVIGIDEKSLRRFPYRSPVDRKFLANLVKTIDSKGARVIGLDILFDQPTEPEKDQALYDVIRATRAPVVVAWAAQTDMLTPAQTTFLKNFSHGLRRGSVGLAASANIVRGTLSDPKAVGGAVAPFARELAAAADHSTSPGGFDIAYRKPTGDGSRSIKIYPAHIAAALPRKWIEGKIIIIGASLAHDDIHMTPYWAAFGSQGGGMRGAEIHAHAVDQIIAGRTLSPAPEVLIWGVFLTMSIAGTVIAALPVSAILLTVLTLGGLLLFWLLAGLAALLGLPPLPIIGPNLSYLVALALSGIFTSIYIRGHARYLRHAFSRYVAESVVKRITANPEHLELAGERRQMTFIFTDVAGFTTLSERTAPRQLIPLLNEYLDGMTDIILEHGGTMDKFVGDAVVCFFGAPEEQPDHATRAVNCAVAIDAFAKNFATGTNAQGVEFGLTRIGVHSGEAVVGNFGSNNFFDYTAIGDTVNTAARIEGLNKVLGGTLAVSHATASQATHVCYRKVGMVVLKGKDKGLQILVPFLAAGDEPELIMAYEQAYDMIDRDLKASLTAFEKLHQCYPSDPLIAFQTARLQNGATGTEIVMTEK